MDIGSKKQGLVVYSSHMYEDETINGYKQLLFIYEFTVEVLLPDILHKYFRILISDSEKNI